MLCEENIVQILSLLQKTQNYLHTATFWSNDMLCYNEIFSHLGGDITGPGVAGWLLGPFEPVPLLEAPLDPCCGCCCVDTVVATNDTQ